MDQFLLFSISLFGRLTVALVDFEFTAFFIAVLFLSLIFGLYTLAVKTAKK